MKGVFVILDGSADLPCQELSQKTPFEAAKTPNLDYFASHSKIYSCYTVKKGVAPQSSSAVVSLLGYNPNFAPRGPLEALGAGVKQKNGDLVFRTNFATIESLENPQVLDRRAGRSLSTKEARILAKAINEKVKLPFKFEFIPTIGHRGVLVFRGGFSGNITNIDPAYGFGVASLNASTKLKFSHPIDDEDNSRLSSELVNNFARQTYEVLNKHPINLKKAQAGFYSANFLLCREAGAEPIEFKKIKGKWLALAYMPLEIGIAKAAGMDIYKFRYPKLKGSDIYGNLHAGLKKAVKYSVKMLKKYHKKYDYFYVHFKETDTPGHDNKPHEKVKMIEYLDEKFFSFLRQFIKEEKLIVTCDHTTACKLKNHTADPVPLMVYPHSSKEKRFTEIESKKGKEILGNKVLEKFLFD